MKQSRQQGTQGPKETRPSNPNQPAGARDPQASRQQSPEREKRSSNREPAGSAAGRSPESARNRTVR
ncbi:MAG: hypothetical protein HOQ05_13545 [Corynebacteriales bacterium]|nr:hypothetical protein [Mycobacteriales bacterium]